MESKIQLQKKARVLAKNEEEVGILERVVVNPETKEITHIVIRTGSILNKEDKIVPIDLVDETVEDQVLLNVKADDAEALTPFEEMSQSEAENETDELTPFESNLGIMLEHPDNGVALLLDLSGESTTSAVQNIPEGTVAMKEGAKVIAAEGKHVGIVERVLADPTVDQITHLLVSKGVLSKEIKMIPIKWVTEIDEDAVHLRVKKDSVDGLENLPDTP